MLDQDIYTTISNQELNLKDYYLLDSFDKIKKYKTADPNDSDAIFLKFYDEQNGIIEEIYNIQNFKNSYDFIHIITTNEKLRNIGFLLPKNKLINQNKISVLSNEIKNSKLINEISHSLNFDLTKDNFDLEEIDNKNIFILTKINYNKKSEYNNFNNHNINNNNSNEMYNNKARNINNINYLDNSNYNYNNGKNIRINRNLNNNYNYNNNNNANNSNFSRNNNPNNNYNNYNYNNGNNNKNNFYNPYNNNNFSNNNNNNYNNFQNVQYNNSNINNNMNYNYQFGNFNNNNNFKILANNCNKIQFQNNQQFLQMNSNNQNNYNNFSLNYNNKEMLSKLLVFSLQTQSINNNIYFEIQNLKNSQYLFFMKGLNNIGPSCFLNATLQCLLHINELVLYFINIYPKDSKNLNKINKDVDTKGQISQSFYNVIKGISSRGYNNYNFNMSKNPNSYNYFSPDEFITTISRYNEQFENFEVNDSKDLILYLFQSIHEELNYLGNNSSLPIINRPNQFDENEAFNFFFTTYKIRNFSVISEIFYGTYKSITTCKRCNSIIYNFQKFELLSFEMYDYKGAIFSLYNGFEDNEKNQQLKGDNQFYCNNCKKLCDAEIKTKIIEAPDKLLINIEYGKNKKYLPSAIIIDEFLDITKYAIDQKEKLKYRLIGVCKHISYPGSTSDYIAFCKNKTSNQWYKFNDTVCSICYNNEVMQGNPYLLLYEKM